MSRTAMRRTVTPGAGCSRSPPSSMFSPLPDAPSITRSSMITHAGRVSCTAEPPPRMTGRCSRSAPAIVMGRASSPRRSSRYSGPLCVPEASTSRSPGRARAAAARSCASESTGMSPARAGRASAAAMTANSSRAIWRAYRAGAAKGPDPRAGAWVCCRVHRVGTAQAFRTSTIAASSSRMMARRLSPACSTRGRYSSRTVWILAFWSSVSFRSS